MRHFSSFITYAGVIGLKLKALFSITGKPLITIDITTYCLNLFGKRWNESDFYMVEAFEKDYMHPH